MGKFNSIQLVIHETTFDFDFFLSLRLAFLMMWKWYMCINHDTKSWFTNLCVCMIINNNNEILFAGSSPSSSLLGLSKEDYRTLTSLVLAAIEGEDCIEKMMCDAGKLVKKVKKADTFLRWGGKFVSFLDYDYSMSDRSVDEWPE